MKQGKILGSILTALFIGMMICALFIFGSCTTTKVVTVEKVKTDTTYITKHQRDSVWLHDSIQVTEKGDTLRIEKWHTKYIEREVHDTLYRAKTDSIPVPYPVEKLVEKPRSTIEKGLLMVGILSIIALVVFAAFKIKKFLP